MFRKFLGAALVVAAFVAGTLTVGQASTPITAMSVGAAPVRVYDSRTDHPGPLVANELINPVVALASDEVVAVNVTVLNPAAAGYVKVWGYGPSGTFSSINFAAGQTVANLAIVAVGDLGSISVWTSAQAHIIVDVQAVWA